MKTKIEAGLFVRSDIYNPAQYTLSVYPKSYANIEGFVMVASQEVEFEYEIVDEEVRKKLVEGVDKEIKHIKAEAHMKTTKLEEKKLKIMGLTFQAKTEEEGERKWDIEDVELLDDDVPF